MAMGRKMVPLQLKVVKGTAQRCRTNANAPKAIRDLPRAPEHMTALGMEWFNRILGRLEAMGIASGSHTEGLMLLASVLADIEKCDRVIGDDGYFYNTHGVAGQELIKQHPAVQLRNDLRRHAQSLLAEFGLTPASMEKVSVQDKPDGNDWSDLT